TADPENVKTILASDFNNFEKGSVFRETAVSVLGTGVFNSDGEMWKFHRTMTRPFFTRERITDFEIFQRHADSAIAKIRERVRSGVPFNFEDVIARFTLDSSTEFLFGQSVDSLHADLPYPHNVPPPLGYIQTKSSSDEFVRAFEDAKRAILERLHSGILWPFRELFRDRSRSAMKVIDAYIDPILQLALERKRINKSSPAPDEKEASTLLDHLLSSTDDQQVIKDEIMNIMVAGRDTTMSTLTFAVYFLSQHPEVLARLRDEVLAKFPEGQIPSYEDLREMKYLRAVLNETLRLFPPVPGNIRQNINGTLLPSVDPKTGKHHYLPPNSFISYSVYIMHRRKDLWGPDADKFDPDRFLDERLQKYLTPNPFIFLPFNAGPRICLGQQFAYNEMSFFLVRLLQAISDVKLAPDSQPQESRPPLEWAHGEGRQAVEKIFPMSFLTMFVKGGLWVTMSEA
ncbi:cytochrome P450, partial [Auricularia subglabra TFB-10046 SS5]